MHLPDHSNIRWRPEHLQLCTTTQAIIRQPEIAFEPALIASVSAALAKAGLHERAGDLAAQLGRPGDALAAYCKGRAYRKAVELARSADRKSVV